MAAHGAHPRNRRFSQRDRSDGRSNPDRADALLVFFPAPVLVRTITRSRAAGGNDTTGFLHPGRIGFRWTCWAASIAPRP